MMPKAISNMEKSMGCGVLLGSIWGLICIIFLFFTGGLLPLLRLIGYIQLGEISFYSLLSKLYLLPFTIGFSLSLVIGGYGQGSNPILGVLGLLVFLSSFTILPPIAGIIIGALLGFLYSRKYKLLRYAVLFVVLILILNWLYVLLAYSSCRSSGGAWYNSYFPGEPLCEPASSDAGKSCSKSSECTNYCWATGPNVANGSCSAYKRNEMRELNYCYFGEDERAHCQAY